MANYKTDDFVSFARTSERFVSGELRMLGSEVYSYGVPIAKLDREKKHIRFNARSFSRTTSMHQGAVTRGFQMHLRNEGWTLTETYNIDA